MSLPTNWVDSTGMSVDAAFLNELGTTVNAAALAVVVSTGSESRPDATVVIWCDTRDAGAERPTNMGSVDLWFTAQES